MGRLIVFEETGDGSPRKGETFVSPIDGLPCLATGDYLPTTLFPILRRLTDEDVKALVAPQPADDERGRFVRECAMRLFLNIEARCMAANMAEGEWESRRDEFASTAIADAESLAARLWEKRS